ncbi:phosphatase PAP2 family protein [Pseudonocardia ailaonensis]|uniref:Phosphatase PAP2 family protein n=1 Tax=Pseudonocardia ailaonensis TaxID=367279 RepID=A0ABN2NEM7_9PSEU
MTPSALPALPAELRRPAAVGVVAATVVFGLLAARYGGDSGYGRVDGHAVSVVDRLTGAHFSLLEQLTRFGSPPLVVAAALLLCAVCLVLGRRRLAVVALVGPGLTGLATTLLKPTIGRTIGDGGYAFPSGHTGGATSIALVAALLLVSLVRPGRTTGIALVVVIALVAGGTIGTAMVAIGAHYPTDTVGGFCAAVALVLGTALALEAVATRRRAMEP